MPSIQLKHQLEGKPETVFTKVREYCDKKLVLKDLGNLKPEVIWTPEKRMGRFEEKGVKGEISVMEDSPCSVSITLEIPFFLIPFKGVIEDSVRKHLAKIG